MIWEMESPINWSVEDRDSFINLLRSRDIEAEFDDTLRVITVEGDL